MRVRINISKIVGYFLSLVMAYKMWGMRGFLFTLGLHFTNGFINVAWEN